MSVNEFSASMLKINKDFKASFKESFKECVEKVLLWKNKASESGGVLKICFPLCYQNNFYHLIFISESVHHTIQLLKFENTNVVEDDQLLIEFGIMLHQEVFGAVQALTVTSYSPFVKKEPSYNDILLAVTSTAIHHQMKLYLRRTKSCYEESSLNEQPSSEVKNKSITLVIN